MEGRSPHELGDCETLGLETLSFHKLPSPSHPPEPLKTLLLVWECIVHSTVEIFEGRSFGGGKGVWGGGWQFMKPRVSKPGVSQSPINPLVISLEAWHCTRAGQEVRQPFILSRTAKLRIWTLRIWCLKGPMIPFCMADALWPGTTLKTLVWALSMRAVVLGLTELCTGVWNPGLKPQIIDSENNDLVLLDHGRKSNIIS